VYPYFRLVTWASLLNYTEGIRLTHPIRYFRLCCREDKCTASNPPSLTKRLVCAGSFARGTISIDLPKEARGGRTGLGTRSGRSSSSIGSLRVGTGPRDRRSKYWDTGTLSPRSFFDTTAKKRGEKRGRAVEICRSEGERERGREGIEIEKKVTRARSCTRKAVLVLILLSQSSFSFLLPLSLSLSCFELFRR